MANTCKWQTPNASEHVFEMKPNLAFFLCQNNSIIIIFIIYASVMNRATKNML